MARPKQGVTKHSINLRAGDFAKLQEIYADSGGATYVIRKLVSRMVDRLDSPHPVELEEFKDE